MMKKLENRFLRTKITAPVAAFRYSKAFGVTASLKCPKIDGIKCPKLADIAGKISRNGFIAISALTVNFKKKPVFSPGAGGNLNRIMPSLGARVAPQRCPILPGGENRLLSLLKIWQSGILLIRFSPILCAFFQLPWR
jgi:hypothetical protein